MQSVKYKQIDTSIVNVFEANQSAVVSIAIERKKEIEKKNEHEHV